MAGHHEHRRKAGAINLLARLIAPFFSRIFPGVPKNHPATGHMVMNFSANLLGLDNAATPFGLKAMESLQTLNPSKDEPTDAQIMFLVLHTSGLTLIPLAIMAQRAILGAADPSDIFIPCMIATYVATVTGIIAVAIRQRINLINGVVLGWLGGMTAAIGGLVWYFTHYHEPRPRSKCSPRSSATCCCCADRRLHHRRAASRRSTCMTPSSKAPRAASRPR